MFDYFHFAWPENLSIFFDNLCIYHVCFDLLSFLSIIFTWWFCRKWTSGTPVPAAVPEEPTEEVKDSEEEEEASETNGLADVEKILNWPENDSIVSNIKKMRQKVIVNELKSKLTKDELENERLTEKMQLEKIFQLLQNQEEKFHMTSMEQLEDQLHLYRI